MSAARERRNAAMREIRADRDTLRAEWSARLAEVKKEPRMRLIQKRLDDLRRQLERLTAEALAEMTCERVAAGRCRHCGGPVPCSSPFGDAHLGGRS